MRFRKVIQRNNIIRPATLTRLRLQEMGASIVANGRVGSDRNRVNHRFPGEQLKFGEQQQTQNNPIVHQH